MHCDEISICFTAPQPVRHSKIIKVILLRSAERYCLDQIKAPPRVVSWHMEN